jgi:hypothetical protein
MTTPPNGTQDAGPAAAEHPLPGARLAEELRLLLDALAERAEPLLNRLATAPTGEPTGEHGDQHTPATCGWCPLCAGMAVLRGERPELAVRAAEHATGLLSVLRAALADREPRPAQPQPGADEPVHERVQHITVRRRDADEDGEC